MYPVSADYRQAMKERVQRHRLRGTIGGVPFDESHILSGHFAISNQCGGSDRVQIGSVYIGQLSATFRGVFANRYDWAGQEILPEFGLVLPGGRTEYIPTGVYTIPPGGAKQTAQGVEVTAYDHMARLDLALASSLSAARTAYEIAALACARCGVELATTAAQFAALPNGTGALRLLVEDSSKTWRDVLAWLGEITACFVTADRAGRIRFQPYGREIVDVIDNAHRLTGGTFSGFETRYSAISYTSAADRVRYRYHLPDDTGLTYDLADNPFLQSESETICEARAMAVLQALQAVRYVPFEASAVGNPAYDLGDCIRFEKGIADSSKISCITGWTFTFQRSYAMYGVGEDPALAEAQNRTEKALSTAISRTVDKQTALSVTNRSAVSVRDSAEAVTVVAAQYATAAGSQVAMDAEILLAVETTETGSAETGWICTDAVPTVTYLSDGSTLSRHPAETWQDGVHILALHHDFVIGRGNAHEFAILLSMAGGNAYAAAGDAVMRLSGLSVGSSRDEWPDEDEDLVNELLYIAVVTPPTKTQYNEMETLDCAGIVVSAYYKDGHIDPNIRSLCVFDPPQGAALETPGPVQVTISYPHDAAVFTTSFDVSVIPLVPERIEVTQYPLQTRLFVGEAVDTTGLVVTAYYAGGTIARDVTADCHTIPANGEVIGYAGMVLVDVYYGAGDDYMVDSFQIISEYQTLFPFYPWADANGADPVFDSEEAYAEFLLTLPAQEINQDGSFPWYSTFGDLWNGPDGQRLYYYCGNNSDLLSPSEAGAENRSYDVSPWATNTTFYAGIPSQTRWNQIKAPWDGTYVITNSIGIDSYYTYGGNTYPVVRRYNAATYYARQGTTLPFSAPGSYEGFQCYTWRGTVYMPVVEVTPDEEIIPASQRAGNILGAYGVQQPDGTVIHAYTGAIVDETSGTVHNPVTGATAAVTSWKYDAAARTYTCDTETGSVTVTYGTEEMTITEGGNVYTVYYYIPPGR